VWRTATQVELGTVEWVGWYNQARLHEALGDVPPVEYEQNALDPATPTSTLLTIESK
jgi:putative transposase